MQGQVIDSKIFTHMKQNYISHWSYIINTVSRKNDTSVTSQWYCFLLNTYSQKVVVYVNDKKNEWP
jgi:hypothetical protein